MKHLKNTVVKKVCHSRKFLSGIYNACRCHNKEKALLNKCVEDPRLRLSGMTPNLMGFTLIELLVVVLIIGILAAVAVPQYQKAVWKSRNVELKQLVSSLAKAQEAYYLANGTYAETLNQLDVDIPAWTSVKNTSSLCAYTTSNKDDSVRYNEDIQVGINTGGHIYVNWLTVPYRCGGFVWGSSSKKISCVERESAPFNSGDFCEKVEGAAYTSTPTSWRFYRL